MPVDNEKLKKQCEAGNKAVAELLKKLSEADRAMDEAAAAAEKMKKGLDGLPD
jgi:hypothetical protein